MACFHPIEGFPRPGGGITFSPPQGYVDLPLMKVPCGQCIGCRLERGRQWTVRMMHEASLHEQNCFLTLTYDEKHLPKGGTLVKSDFQDFMKRFRKWLEPKRISYFMCGEYGSQKNRPHYHAIIFGFDFRGQRYVPGQPSDPLDRLGACSRRHPPKGFQSPELKELWPMGNNYVGTVTAQSCGYVARYCLKKVTGVQADEHYRRIDPDTGEIFWLLPEYANMSTRPGIGKEWYARFGSDVAAYDGVFVDGKRGKPPRYYDRLRKRHDADGIYEAKLERKRSAVAKAADNTPDRLAVREHVATARANLFGKRSL